MVKSYCIEQDWHMVWSEKCVVSWCCCLYSWGIRKKRKTINYCLWLHCHGHHSRHFRTFCAIRHWWIDTQNEDVVSEAVYMESNSEISNNQSFHHEDADFFGEKQVDSQTDSTVNIVKRGEWVTSSTMALKQSALPWTTQKSTSRWVCYCTFRWSWSRTF